MNAKPNPAPSNGQPSNVTPLHNAEYQGKLNDPAIPNGWEGISEIENKLSWSRLQDNDPHLGELLKQYIYIEMAATDLVLDDVAKAKVELPEGVLANLEEKNRLLAQLRAPIDGRIESYLTKHFADLQLDTPLRLPDQTLVLDRHGMARELALPDGANYIKNEYVTSYRLANGVLHNPAADRRTTAGTFHVAEGGLPIPDDKVAVPKSVFAELFKRALTPPDSLLQLPSLRTVLLPRRRSYRFWCDLWFVHASKDSADVRRWKYVSLFPVLLSPI